MLGERQLSEDTIIDTVDGSLGIPPLSLSGLVSLSNPQHGILSEDAGPAVHMLRSTTLVSSCSVIVSMKSDTRNFPNKCQWRLWLHSMYLYTSGLFFSAVSL